MSYSGSVGRQTIGSLGSSEDSTNGSIKKPTLSEKHPKVVRSLTVVAYIFCVSIAAILLSAYYLLIYKIDPKKPPAIYNTTNSPCRTGVPYNPDAGWEYANTGGTYYSRRMSSSFRVPRPVLPPQPSEVTSNFDHSRQGDSPFSENSHNSLHRFQTTSALASHDSSSSKTSRTHRYDQQQHGKTSAFLIARKHATTPNPTPIPNSAPSTPKSILMQKLFTKGNVNHESAR